MTRLAETLAAIDQLHQMDPSVIDDTPAELSYARQMTHWLQQLAPDASEELQIAVRSQHLCRWEIPRSEYPEGRTGYLKWRTELGKLHARKAGEIMARNGYSEASCAQASTIIRKQGIKRNADTQTLEDCACLVFLTRDFSAFAAKHPRDKVIAIVQKTWKKMSEQAQQKALALPFAEPDLQVLQEALA
ncbi:DUF4202 domain-containing protein [Salinisphaera sp. G21_0]|uniref:DUF4202 domain-containing protein n=1 Tax=Salinisphaera sp. G21_0 TaxID=2821094 RepID=UPI001ADAA2BE|nr:DUF4202 domain-containing protein [Salinisphaera sp. G21_0]MBO9481849.1 DUF4202 domain-containing protein [Salinisphaera sp. G21_0]